MCVCVTACPAAGVLLIITLTGSAVSSHRSVEGQTPQSPGAHYPGGLLIQLMLLPIQQEIITVTHKHTHRPLLLALLDLDPILIKICIYLDCTVKFCSPKKDQNAE